MVWHNLTHYWRQWRTSGHVGQPRSLVDQIPGVETHRAVYLSALDLKGEHGADAQPYEPISDEAFVSMVDALPIEPADYTFVDLGSGKGRALLLAARAGFGRIIGVEYSSDLHEHAQRNMAAAHGHWPGVGRIELVHGDASEFVPPCAPTVCFLFNPFGPSVMSKVIDTWSRHIGMGKDDVWVVYGNPTQRGLFSRSAAFDEYVHIAGFVVYRRVSPSSAQAQTGGAP